MRWTRRPRPAAGAPSASLPMRPPPRCRCALRPAADAPSASPSPRIVVLAPPPIASSSTAPPLRPSCPAPPLRPSCPAPLSTLAVAVLRFVHSRGRALPSRHFVLVLHFAS
ncbi:uncharacterized protein SCHCODRAFT_02639906 [Schizophyllum commune H4-8]|uniref:uncharacterized protein n=1 Tax=Schizophyllum commune (strain H4-8 / FGSC 9210) TaxID=578458 RepID=UPI00215F7345|nr:uncharacterized protein SCHCODRAFT_02639906 [Schizophyllum commune H4-8]KAI5886820.1 hypothetical protein SCHCODRAFT_02639906 [Schizophyllum commune H4-8]